MTTLPANLAGPAVSGVSTPSLNTDKFTQLGQRGKAGAYDTGETVIGGVEIISDRMLRAWAAPYEAAFKQVEWALVIFPVSAAISTSLFSGGLTVVVVLVYLYFLGRVREALP